MAKSKKELRKRKASNIAASLAVSGIPVNLSKVSSQTLEGIISKSDRNTPLARKAAAELAGRYDGMVMRRKKGGKVR